MDNQQMIAIVVGLVVVGILGFTTGLAINVSRDDGSSNGSIPANSSPNDDNSDSVNYTNELDDLISALNNINSEIGNLNTTDEVIDYTNEIVNISIRILEITNELNGINSTLVSYLQERPDNITLGGLEELSDNLDNVTNAIINLNHEPDNITLYGLEELSDNIDNISLAISNLPQEPDNITLYGLEELSTVLDNITLAIEELKFEPEVEEQYGNVSFSGVAQFKFQTGAVIYPEHYGYINISKNGTTLIFNFTDMWKLSNTNGNPWNSTVRGGIDQYWMWACFQDGILTDQFVFGRYSGITNGTLGNEDHELADDMLVLPWTVSKVPDQIGFYDSSGSFFAHTFH